MLSAQPRSAGVTVTTIHFPSPHPTSFAVAGVTHVYGAPQVTTAGDPQEQPQWNQTMFFLGDESSLFTATSALVVEYYPSSLGETVLVKMEDVSHFSNNPTWSLIHKTQKSFRTDLSLLSFVSKKQRHKELNFIYCLSNCFSCSLLLSCTWEMNCFLKEVFECLETENSNLEAQNLSLDSQKHWGLGSSFVWRLST